MPTSWRPAGRIHRRSPLTQVEHASWPDRPKPWRAHGRRRHPRAQRGRQDRPRPRQVPRDGRFEAIVVDDGSTDGTGDEARAHGAALVIRHEERGGVGAAIRDGWKGGARPQAPYLALLSGDDQHEPAELVPALDACSSAQGRLRPGLALAARRPGRWPGRRSRLRDPALLARLQRPRPPPGHRRRPTASGSSGRTSCAIRRSISTRLADELRPRAVRALQGDPARLPGDRGSLHRPLPRQEGYTKMRGLATGGACSGPASLPADRGQAMTEPSDGRASPAGASSSPAAPGSSAARSCAASSRRARRSPSSTTCSPAGPSVPTERPARRGLGHRRDARPRARRPTRRSSSTWPRGTSSPRRRTRASDFATNIGGTLNVLMAARDSPVDRVVYTRLDVDLRQPAHDPDQRGRPARPALAVRGEQARRRALLHRLLRELRPAGRGRPLLERLRERPAARQPVLRRHREVLRRRASTARRSRSTATASRRATSPTSTTRSTRPCSRRSSRAPRARSSTSAPASRRRSTRSPS